LEEDGQIPAMLALQRIVNTVITKNKQIKKELNAAKEKIDQIQNEIDNDRKLQEARYRSVVTEVQKIRGGSTTGASSVIDEAELSAVIFASSLGVQQ